MRLATRAVAPCTLCRICWHFCHAFCYSRCCAVHFMPHSQALSSRTSLLALLLRAFYATFADTFVTRFATCAVAPCALCRIHRHFRHALCYSRYCALRFMPHLLALLSRISLLALLRCALYAAFASTFTIRAVRMSWRWGGVLEMTLPPSKQILDKSKRMVYT